MAKFLENDGNGNLREVQPIIQSAGAQDANKIPQTGPNGKFDQSLIDLTGVGGPDLVGIMTSEVLSAGDLVNIYNDNGVAKVRKAVATAIGTRAWGYVIAGYASGVLANIYKDDANNQVTGLVPGPQFLSDTQPGKAQATPPTGAGKIVQGVGMASSATTLHVTLERPIILAG